MSDALLSTLLERYPYLTERSSADIAAVNCPASELAGFMSALRDEERFALLLDITAVDWTDERDPRFTCVYHLFGIDSSRYLRVASDCESTGEPVMPSVTDLWATANWHEREVFDMFGIRFAGHPDLRRILMWDEYPHFPLRKDFPLAGKEMDLPAADVAERTDAKLIAAPMMGGPFHAGSGKPMSAMEPRGEDESWRESRPKPAASQASTRKPQPEE